MKTVRHAPGVRQTFLARFVEGRSHVHAVAVHLRPLRRRQTLQALPPGRFVPPRLHRQQPRPLRVRQVGQQRHVQLVPLLQADLVHAHVANHPRRVDALGLLQLMLDDAVHRFRGDTQAPGNVCRGAADQQTQDVLFKSERIAGVLALERRDQVLAMMAARAAVKDPFIDPEARLAADIEVPHHALFAVQLQVRRILVPAALAATLRGPGPGDLEAVALAAALVAGEFDALGQIDVDGDAGHSRPWQQVSPLASLHSAAASAVNGRKCS